MARRAPLVGTAGTIYPPAERIARNARRAEEKGYASIWWPDHLMGWHPESLWDPELTPLARSIQSPHAYVDAVAAIAVASTATEKILLGTAVAEAVRRHPAMLAQEFLTLQHFARGRVVLGIGAGEGENILPYGLDFSKPVTRLEEAVEIIRAFFANVGPIDYRGARFSLHKAVVGLAPFEGRPPPVWIAAHGPRMLDLCGRLGDGWIPTALPKEEYAAKLARVRASAAHSGRPEGAITAAMFAYCAPAPDHETAHRILHNPLVKCFCMALGAERFSEAGYEHPLGPGSYGLLDFVPAGMTREQATALVDAIPFEVVHEFVWHGTAEEIFESAVEYAEAGLEHLVLWNVSPFDFADTGHRSFRILDDVARACQESQ